MKQLRWYWGLWAVGILRDEGNERNAEAYKAPGEDDSFHCKQ